jgi:hypothetical protein
VPVQMSVEAGSGSQRVQEILQHRQGNLNDEWHKRLKLEPPSMTGFVPNAMNDDASIESQLKPHGVLSS